MIINILKYIYNLIYYNTEPVKVLPKVILTAKKFDMVYFKPVIVSINTPQIRHTKPETI